MKKIMSVILMGILLILLAGCGSSGGGSGSNDNGGGSSSQQSSSTKAITEYRINGVEGTIDEKAKTIMVVFPYVTDPNTYTLDAMVAHFETTGAEVVVNGTAQITDITFNDFTHPVDYEVIAENGSSQHYTVTVTIGPSSEKSILTYSLDGVSGTIDETGKTVSVSLPVGTSVTALAATFTLSDGASAKVGQVVQVNGQTPNDFTNPVVYEVIAADGSTQNYTVTVTFATKATAINVSMTPNEPSDGKVAPGTFCTRTLSITGTISVTDADGKTNVTWQWLYNGTVISSNSAFLSDPNGITTTTLANTDTPHGYFQANSVIEFMATADGGVSNSVSHQVV